MVALHSRLRRALPALSHSRLGRRIVLQFLLATSVPLVVLAVLGHGVFVAQAQHHQAREMAVQLDAAAMQVFDRLLLARAALATLAQTAASAPGQPSGSLRRIFRRIETAGGAPADGTNDLRDWWSGASEAADVNLHHRGTGADGMPALVLSVRASGATVWLGELDPAYLWSDTLDGVAADRVCIADAGGRPLHCTDPPVAEGLATAAPADPGAAAMVKRLFMAHEFGVGDWLFTARGNRAVAIGSAVPLASLAWKAVAAGLLLVAVLSLVQVRRTLAPLQRLVDGTRQLAGHDYAARVAVTGDDEFGQLARSFNDMATHLEAHVRQLDQQATHDSLTGLGNRASLQISLTRALADAAPFAVLFIDLDRFKTVNDTLGHHAGDALLCMAARRLQSTLGSDADISRPGGDEFVVLLAPVADAAAAHAAAASICAVMAAPFPIEGRDIVLGASVGWVLAPEDGHGPSDLLRHADLAMYAAKDDGRGQARRFEPQMDRDAMERAWLVDDLRHAVARGELSLHYQPRVDAVDRIAHGAEALVRWQHPRRGPVSPVQFIAIAEETGLIVEIGHWVLREACRQLQQWRRDGVALSALSVNVSALQLQHLRLVDDVAAALHDHGLTPEDLEIEVTESVFIGDHAAASAVLGRLRAMGLKIALDDFGTGYSSLAYLSRMPMDVLKIDRAFVKDLGSDRTADTITRAIVTLAQSLDLALVAEGVETEAQARTLTAMGCQQLQGYLFARPVAADSFARLPCVRAVPAGVTA